jgi:hypothetical protein
MTQKHFHLVSAQEFFQARLLIHLVRVHFQAKKQIHSMAVLLLQLALDSLALVHSQARRQIQGVQVHFHHRQQILGVLDL